MIKPTALALALAVGFAPAAGLAHTPTAITAIRERPRPTEEFTIRTCGASPGRRGSRGRLSARFRLRTRTFPRSPATRTIASRPCAPAWPAGRLIGTFTLCEMATVYSTPISRSKRLGRQSRRPSLSSSRAAPPRARINAYIERRIERDRIARLATTARFPAGRRQVAVRAERQARRSAASRLVRGMLRLGLVGGRRLLLALFVGHVMADGAAADRAEDGVVAGQMAGHAADRRPL